MIEAQINFLDFHQFARKKGARVDFALLLDFKHGPLKEFNGHVICPKSVYLPVICAN